MNSIENQTFKGNYCSSSNGTSYYKTNSGIKTGGVFAGIGTIGLAESLYKKKYTRAGVSLGGIACYLLCGAIYDNIRNKKAENAANDIRNLGVQGAMLQNKNLEISRRGNIYYNSNEGGKYGAMLGAGVGLAYGLASSSIKKEWADIVKIFEKDGYKINKPVWVAASMAVCALGGLIMGKIADHYSNKDARRNS